MWASSGLNSLGLPEPEDHSDNNTTNIQHNTYNPFYTSSTNPAAFTTSYVSTNAYTQNTTTQNPHPGPSQLPPSMGCISVANGIVETEIGVSLKLESPQLPLAILCGSKNKPSNISVTVAILGRFTQIITSMSLSVVIGDHFHNTTTTKNSEQKTLSVSLSLNKGNDLRPLPFKVEFSCNMPDGKYYKKFVKDTYCIMMTAPCTQRRKAFSLLAWQENISFVKHVKITVKGNKLSQDVIPVKVVKDSLIGRWKHIFPSYPFPEGFNILLDDLTSNGFFKEVLEKRGKDPQLLVSLLQQEFSTIWMWYEAVFSFISDNPELFFEQNLIQICTRTQCEKFLSAWNINLFAIRFGSKEDSLVISCKNGDSINHVLLTTKEFPQQLIEKVTVLEEGGYKFYCEGDEPRNTISDVLKSFLNSKLKQKKSEAPSNYLVKDVEFFKMISQKSSESVPTPGSEQVDFSNLFTQQGTNSDSLSSMLFSSKFDNSAAINHPTCAISIDNPNLNIQNNNASNITVNTPENNADFFNLISKRNFSEFSDNVNNISLFEQTNNLQFKNIINENNVNSNATQLNNNNNNSHVNNDKHHLTNNINNNSNVNYLNANINTPNPQSNVNINNDNNFIVLDNFSEPSVTKKIKTEENEFEKFLLNPTYEESESIFDWRQQP